MFTFRQTRFFKYGLNNSFARIDKWPSVFPGERNKEGFTSKISVISSTIWSWSKTYHPPFAILCLDNVRMSDINDWIVDSKMSVGKDWITRITLKWFKKAFTSGNCYWMHVTGACLWYKKIVPSINLINVRTLRPFNPS